jgi:hypothetical protein
VEENVTCMPWTLQRLGSTGSPKHTFLMLLPEQDMPGGGQGGQGGGARGSATGVAAPAAAAAAPPPPQRWLSGGAFGSMLSLLGGVPEGGGGGQGPATESPAESPLGGAGGGAAAAFPGGVLSPSDAIPGSSGGRAASWSRGSSVRTSLSHGSGAAPGAPGAPGGLGGAAGPPAVSADLAAVGLSMAALEAQRQLQALQLQAAQRHDSLLQQVRRMSMEHPGQRAAAAGAGPAAHGGGAVGAEPTEPAAGDEALQEVWSMLGELKAELGMLLLDEPAGAGGPEDAAGAAAAPGAASAAARGAGEQGPEEGVSLGGQGRSSGDGSSSSQGQGKAKLSKPGSRLKNMLKRAVSGSQDGSGEQR